MIFVKIVIKKKLVSCCEANLYSSVLELRTYVHAVLKSCLRGQTADVLYKLAPTTDTCICSNRMTGIETLTPPNSVVLGGVALCWDGALPSIF